ncbi:MAG TPA: protein kinase, partial [Vicinamibacterales bacterium]|nr:protein kinase [Vicinamibacterales bacterium]
MTLARGTFVGHYEVLQQLGAGGMGQVYRARDTKLGRDVALKILPETFAADPDRLARFRREALTLASLNDPHIVHIHGIVEGEAPLALVMEFVDGEDLAQRLARGAISIEDALPIAQQIAEALEVAHAAGIFHRDLKPANIKLRADGTVKVLDFGLAKMTAPETCAGLMDSPTIMSPTMTHAGMILGTAAYMAPEQAKGRTIDRRADIWGFGCVLFEMLAGRRCFEGETVTETLAAVLEREPDWKALPARTPESIRRLLIRCLQKDPHHRLHDIADGRIEIADPIVTTATTPTRAVGLSRPARWTIGLGIITIAALVAALIRLSTSSEAPPRDVHVHRLTDLTGLEESPALSPDGKSVAFAAGVGDKRQVFVQLVAGGTPLQITRDPVDHQFPRWLPDSSAIVYFSPARPGDAQGTIWEVSALGGAPRRVANSVGSADVGVADGRLAFFRLANKRIELVIAGRDGAGVAVVARFAPARYHLYPRWSPDGKWIAFQVGDGIRSDVFVVSSAGGEPRQLTHENTTIAGLAWVPDSQHVLYSSSRADTMPYLPTTALWQVALADGSVRQITSGELSYVYPDVGRNGLIVAGQMRLQTDIWQFPAEGQPAENVSRGIRVTRQTGQVLTPSAGPDGKQIVFLSNSGGHANLWIIDATSGERRQITYERDPSVAVGVPVWSPDGRAIAFVYTRGNPGLTFGVWLVDPDGSSLRSIANPGLGPAWSPDGRWVYYSTRGGAANTDVVL